MGDTVSGGSWLDRLRQAFAQPVEKLSDAEAMLLGQRILPAAATGPAAGRAATPPAQCTVPFAPPGVNINNNIRHGEELGQTESLSGRLMNAYSMFHNKAPYDYKQLGKGRTPNPYEDFGNFDYGAMGAAMGIPDQVLLRAGGVAGSQAGTRKPEFGHWWGGPPYGDDPKDQAQIEAGINYFRNCYKKL